MKRDPFLDALKALKEQTNESKFRPLRKKADVTIVDIEKKPKDEEEESCSCGDPMCPGCDEENKESSVLNLIKELLAGKE